MEEFDVVEYLQKIRRGLVYTRGYELCRVSDPKTMEEVIQAKKRAIRFFVIDDSQDGAVTQGDGGGWFERRPVVVFLLGRLERWPDTAGRDGILREMRIIFKKILGKLIRDREVYEALAYLDTTIPFDEIPGGFAGGTAGLFFTFTINIPVNLDYDESEWE